MNHGLLIASAMAIAFSVQAQQSKIPEIQQVTEMSVPSSGEEFCQNLAKSPYAGKGGTLRQMKTSLGLKEQIGNAAAAGPGLVKAGYEKIENPEFLKVPIGTIFLLKGNCGPITRNHGHVVVKCSAKEVFDGSESSVRKRHTPLNKYAGCVVSAHYKKSWDRNVEPAQGASARPGKPGARP